MPGHPDLPPDAARARNPFAATIIDDTLKLRALHPAEPTLDIPDVVLQGRCSRPIDFGEISPMSPFGLLTVEAFDRGMPVINWIGLYRYPAPRVIDALDVVWRKEVWPEFTAHFGLA